VDQSPAKLEAVESRCDPGTKQACGCHRWLGSGV